MRVPLKIGHAWVARVSSRWKTHYMRSMARTHPHAEATYTVVPLEDGTFGVKVAIPETYPTTISPFASEADAEAWVAKHKTQVEAGATSGQWFRKTGGGRRG